MSNANTNPVSRRPIRFAFLIVLGIVAFHVAGEFGSGFIDGLVTGFTDGV